MSKRKEFNDEFKMAKKALAPFGGDVSWSDYDYEAFRYKSDSVQLIFYPHKTSAGHYHIRMRDAGSKDKAVLDGIRVALRDVAGYCCTFRERSK